MNTPEKLFEENYSVASGMFVFMNSEDGNYSLTNTVYSDNEIGRITTLSELFLEWFLFDSSYVKDIKTFLEKSDLKNVFTETEFIDLMCGGAYVDENLILFISKKIPFQIQIDKIKRLNQESVLQNRGAYLIKSKPNIIEKIHIAVQERKEFVREYNRKYKRRFYQLNKKLVLERNKQWRLNHVEQYRTYQSQWRQDNAEHLKRYFKKYRKTNAQAVSERKKKCYVAKHEQYCKKNKENYEANKERYLAQQKRYYAEIKQKSEQAKQICPAYVFLLNMKKTNKEQYSKLYTGQQKPIIKMLKTCPALQNTDINQCPVCNNGTKTNIKKVCNQKIFSVTNVISKLKVIADTLKQKHI